MPPRKVSDISADVRDALSRGERQTGDLVEAFTVDFAQLASNAAPGLSTESLDTLRNARGLAYTRRMALAASLFLQDLGDAAFTTLAAHPADTARGWACYIAGMLPGRSVGDRLTLVRPLADDAHFGVREWAWLGVRPAIVADPFGAVAALASWTTSPGDRLRRFASEATRPRGVWSAHITEFKRDPSPALPLLEPLRSDPSKYVRDSVANWLNDAAKSRPDWVLTLRDRWLTESPTTQTASLLARATRSIKID